MSVEQAVLQSFEAQKNDTQCTYFIARTFAAFEGHFEHHPLLPAVVQMSLCADTISRLTGKAQQIHSVSRAKFVRPILPDSSLVVTVAARPDGQFACTISTETGEKCSQLIVRTEDL